MPSNTTSHRLFATVMTVLGTVLGSVTVAATPALAASVNDCSTRPSNDTCNGAQVTKGDACWVSSYVVQPTKGGQVTYDDNGWQFTTQLRFSTACRSNFAYTEVTEAGAGVYNVSNKVRRNGDNSDGGYLMEHGPWISMYSWSTGSEVLSRAVYSPNNSSAACLSNNSNDQVQCTPGL